MQATMRKTGKSVNRAAVEGLWKKLFILWEANPLGFVDFTAHSRRRSYKIDSQCTVQQLLQLGLVDNREKFPVHDSIRELVATCVEGTGITTMLHRPFAGEDTAVSMPSTLLSGKQATHHIAAAAYACLVKLMEVDYTAFVEYVRLVRDRKHPSNLYGDSLKRLVQMGMVKLLFEGDEDQKADYELVQEIFGGGPLVDGPVKVVPNEVLDTVLLEVATGDQGLDICVKASPFRKSTPSSQGNGRANGHSSKKASERSECTPRSAQRN